MKISEAASQQFLTLLSMATKNSLSVGDTFVGRILSVENSLVWIQLLDGSKISAQVKSDTQYSAGDVLKLEVVEQTQGQILVKETEFSPATTLQTQDELQNPEKLLNSLKLPVDKDYVEVMGAFVKMGVTPTAELVTRSVNLLRGKEISDPKQAVFLSVNNMDHQEAYFPVVKQFGERAFQFQEKWQHLFQQLGQMDEQSVMAMADKFLLHEAAQSLGMEQAFQQIREILAPHANPTQPETDVNLSASLEKILLNLITDEDNTLFMDKDIFNELEATFPAIKNLPVQLQNELQKILRNVLNAAKEQKYAPPKDLAEAKTIIERMMTVQDPKIEVGSSRARLPKAEEWMMDAEKKLDLILEGLAQTVGADADKILPDVRELKAAIHFFQDITQYEAFAQIPLVLADNSTQGELYVMKRKGTRKKLTADDFSLFLSLTTKNLGYWYFRTW